MNVRSKLAKSAVLIMATLLCSIGNAEPSKPSQTEVRTSTAKVGELTVKRRTYKTSDPKVLARLRVSRAAVGSRATSSTPDVTATTASSKLDTVSSLSSDECYGLDLCGEIYVDEAEFYWDYMDELSNQWETAYFKLEQVEVYGTCSVEVSGPWGTGYASCADYTVAVDDAMAADTAASEGLDRIFDALEQLFAPEKMEKCAPMTEAKDAQVTLTTDKKDGYAAAERAFLAIYGGSLPAVHTSAQVDIKYPDGWVYTFSVAWVDINNRTVELYNPIFTKTSESTCK